MYTQAKEKLRSYSVSNNDNKYLLQCQLNLLRPLVDSLSPDKIQFTVKNEKDRFNLCTN